MLLRSSLHVPAHENKQRRISCLALLPEGDLNIAGLNFLFPEVSYLHLMGNCLVSLTLLIWVSDCQYWILSNHL